MDSSEERVVPEPAPAPAPASPATPAAPEGEEGDAGLFLTHMPGAHVGPRAQLETDPELIEAARAAAKARVKGELRGAGDGPAAAAKSDTSRRARPDAAGDASSHASSPVRRSLTGRLVAGAKRVAEGAGRHALERTLQASRRTGLVGTAADGMLVAGPVATPPSMGRVVARALVAPVRPANLACFVLAFLLLAVGLLLLELMPKLGLAALAIALVQLAALRYHQVRELAEGHDRVAWPGGGETLASLPPYLAALAAVFAPMLVASYLAWPASIDPADPASLPARALRVWEFTPRAAPQTASDVHPLVVTMGRNELGLLGAVVGPPDAQASPVPQVQAEAVARASLEVGQALLRVEGASSAGLAARGLLLAGWLFFPMALLAAARLRSVFAPLHLPLLLRSIFSAPLAYLVVVAGFAAADLALAACALGLGAVTHAFLPPVPAQCLTVGATTAVAVGALLGTGALLGGFYESRKQALGW